MATIIQDAPEGFGLCIDLLNKLPKEVISEMSTDVIDFLQFKIGAIKTDKWKQVLGKTARQSDPKTVQNLINAITYIFRHAAKYRLNAEDFKQQINESMLFSDNSQRVLYDTWTTHGKNLLLPELKEHMQGVGQLIDLQWKIGLAVSSNSCKNLNSPFVTLNLTVADPAGKLTAHNLEMNLTQFRNFTKQVKEIATVMETV